MENDILIRPIIESDNEDANLLVITNDGFGKRVKIGEFRVQGRGGLGLIGTKFKTPKSKLATIRIVSHDDEFIIATAAGVIVRQKVSDIPFQSRMATGVRVQKLQDDDSVVNITPIIKPEEDEAVQAASEVMEKGEAGDGSEQLALVGGKKGKKKKSEPEVPDYDEEPFEELE